MMAFLDQLRPDLIVSLHQHFNAVDLGPGKVRVWSLRLASAHAAAQPGRCPAAPDRAAGR